MSEDGAKSLICAACSADMVCLEHGLSLPCDMCLVEGVTSSLMCGRCGGTEAREVSDDERKDLLEKETNPQAAKFKNLMKSADSGDVAAGYAIAMMYWNSDGVDHDESAAVRWIRKGADRGHAESQYWLGNAHLQGDGVKKSAPEAVKWLRKAANQNFAEAQYELAKMLMKGRGSVEADLDEAKHWLQKAADQGNQKAKEALFAARTVLPYDEDDDPLYHEAVEIVLKTRRPSISLVQRHLRIGYNRAARLIERMEKNGLVSPMQGNGNREVLIGRGREPVPAPVPDGPAEGKPKDKDSEHLKGTALVSMWVGGSFIAGFFIGSKFWITSFVIVVLLYMFAGKALGKGSERSSVALVGGVGFSGIIFLGIWVVGLFHLGGNSTVSVTAQAPMGASSSKTPKQEPSCELSALRSHFVSGIKEPVDCRRNGATLFPA